MATSLSGLQLEPIIMDDGEKINLGIRWNKYITKFENFLVAMNINEDKRKVAMLFVLEEVVYETLLTMLYLK